MKLRDIILRKKKYLRVGLLQLTKEIDQWIIIEIDEICYAGMTWIRCEVVFGCGIPPDQCPSSFLRKFVIVYRVIYL